jgi:hypothetical protein
VDLDLLRNVRKIVCHKDCHDGIASALILHDALPDAEVAFVQYDTPEHRSMVPEFGTLWCDITPWAERDKGGRLTTEGIRQINNWRFGNQTIVLDHHPSARESVGWFGERGVFADEPGVSGAMLAYEEVWLQFRRDDSTEAWVDPVTQRAHSNGTHPPGWLDRVGAFAELAGIRDTWRRSDSRWLQACAQAAALCFWPVDLLLREGLEKVIATRLDIGEVLLQRQEIEDEKILSEAFRFTHDRGLKVVAFEGSSRNASDIAERLGREADLVLAWHYLQQSGGPALKVSARSHATFPVQQFAEFFGGGGHERSAGFLVKGAGEMAPFTIMRSLVQQFLSRKLP